MTSTSQCLIGQNHWIGTQRFRCFWCPETTGCPYSLSKMYGNRRRGKGGEEKGGIRSTRCTKVVLGILSCISCTRYPIPYKVRKRKEYPKVFLPFPLSL
uniref:Uncharacterized protein n=1 Tax=Podoviridae sp. ctRnx2 TaxID=2826555 RepID=A0A8S5QTH6_9CAUD|nr:MAG TPA: hypothetical protein [Podoviridae sp. ctRnx2]